MGGNTGEIEIGSERELCKYTNHQAGDIINKSKYYNNYISTDVQYV